MQLQLDEAFFKNYKELIIGVIIIVLLAIFGIRYIVISASKLQSTTKEYKTKQNELKEAKKKLEEFEKAKQEMLDKQNKIKPVFAPKAAPEDSIASFGGMFEDIIDYVKMNGIMLRSVEYSINPPEDPIYSQFPALYNVCRVNLFIVGTYAQLEGFMRDLTVYPYFINIAELNIEPYQKDKEYLLVNVSITLYSKKQQSVGSVL